MKDRPYNSVLDHLVQCLGRLPGIGNRSAQRIAFHLLKAPPQEAAELAEVIAELRRKMRQCSVCGNISESDPCPICADPQRDHGLVLVVEQPGDLLSLEAAGLYQGVYHVLMGRLSPLEGLGPGELNIHGLMERVAGGQVREAILGTNPTLEGDGTALYLAEQLTKAGVKVSRLARGLPTGSNLEWVSKAVLADALQGRQTVG